MAWPKSKHNRRWRRMILRTMGVRGPCHKRVFKLAFTVGRILNSRLQLDFVIGRMPSSRVAATSTLEGKATNLGNNWVRIDIDAKGT
jgi:hypothetical protein